MRRLAHAGALALLGFALCSGLPGQRLGQTVGSTAPPGEPGPPPSRYTDCFTITPEADMTFSALDFASCPPGTDNLNPEQVFNSTAMTLVAEYFGKDAGASSWAGGDAGPTLSLAGTGSAPVTGRDAPWSGNNDGAVELAGNGQKYYEAASSDDADIGTDDIVSTIIARARTTPGNAVLVSKKATGTAAGYQWSLSNGSVSFTVSDGSTSQTVTTNNAIWDDDEWFVATVVVDSSTGFGGNEIFANGRSHSATGAPSSVDSITNTSVLTIGDRNGGEGVGADVDLAYFGIWTCDACLGGVGTFTDDALEVHMRIFGLMPRYSSAAVTVDKWDWQGSKTCWNSTQQKIHRVADAFLCTDKVDGFLHAEAATNRVLQTEVLSTSWTLTDADDSIGDNTDVAPDGETTMDTLIVSATGGDSTHCLQQVTIALDPNHTFSVFAKPKARDWVYVNDGDFTAYVNASTCAAGTTSGLSTITTSTASGSSCRIIVNSIGTSGAKTVELCSAEGDNDHTYTGAGVADIGFWGVNYYNGDTDQSTFPYSVTTSSIIFYSDSQFGWKSASFSGVKTVKQSAKWTSGVLTDATYRLFSLADSADKANENVYAEIVDDVS